MDGSQVTQTKEHILITGGAGYIGSVLVPILLNLGYKITVIDNFMYGQSSLLDCIHSDKLNVIYEDVRNKEMLLKYVQAADIIIPLAAIVGAPACQRAPQTAREVNVEQAENIAKIISPNQKVLFPVTNSGYGIGEAGKECDETSPLKPISLYGKTKVEAERIIINSCEAITFRLATVFGTSPRMRVDLLVNDFVYRAFNDRFIVLFESHFKRNYIHIRDVAAAFIHGIDDFNNLKGNVYNIGLSSANLSKLELCEQIKKHIPNFQIIQNEFAEDPDKRDYIVSNAKIEATGWRPQYDLDDGIQELIRAFKFLRMNNFNNK